MTKLYVQILAQQTNGLQGTWQSPDLYPQPEATFKDLLDLESLLNRTFKDTQFEVIVRREL